MRIFPFSGLFWEVGAHALPCVPLLEVAALGMDPSLFPCHCCQLHCPQSPLQGSQHRGLVQAGCRMLFSGAGVTLWCSSSAPSQEKLEEKGKGCMGTLCRPAMQRLDSGRLDGSMALCPPVCVGFEGVTALFLCFLSSFLLVLCKNSN